MKDMDAMTLAVIRDWARTGVQPERDIVLAFVADEEAGGKYGAHWLVDNHPDYLRRLHRGDLARSAASRSPSASDLRLYLIQTAEKGIGWLQLRAEGRPGHGSMVHPDNAVTELARAVTRIGEYEFPIHLTPDHARVPDPDRRRHRPADRPGRPGAGAEAPRRRWPG